MLSRILQYSAMRILKRAMPFNPRNAPKCDPNVFNIQVYETYNVARLNARIMKKRNRGRPHNAVGGLHVQPDSDSNSSEPDGNASESSSLVLSSSDEEIEENEEEADEGQRAEHE